jgi:hypothetical protein
VSLSVGEGSFPQNGVSRAEPRAMWIIVHVNWAALWSRGSDGGTTLAGAANTH